MKSLYKKLQGAVSGFFRFIAWNAWQGFLAVAPWVITIWLVIWFYGVMVDITAWITDPISAWMFGEAAVQDAVKGTEEVAEHAAAVWQTYGATIIRNVVGPVLAIVLLVFWGLFTRQKFFRWVQHWFDERMKEIPLVGKIFKLIWDTSAIMKREAVDRFSRVVFIEAFRPGLKLLGFVTSEMETKDGRKLLAIFVPTTPMPNSGQLMFVFEDQTDVVSPAPFSVEDATKAVFSLGIVLPQIDEVHDLTMQNDPKWREGIQQDLNELKGGLEKIDSLETRLKELMD